MRLPVLTALGAAPWESDVITALDAAPTVVVVRRCVDVVELLALAGTGLAQCALIGPDLRRFDADVVDRLLAAEVVPVGVIARDDVEAEQRLLVLGIRHFVSADAAEEVIVAVLTAAVEQGVAGHSVHAFGDPAAATQSVNGHGGTPSGVIPPTGTAQSVPTPTERGSVIAVWGPTGAPGRTTVAVGVADELARLGRSTLLIDADVYGGVIAPTLGLLDESPGLAAACRSAGASRLDAAGLAGLAWQLGPHLRVLTGIPRAERWPELRTAGVEAVLSAARGLAEFTVVDCGFALEADEELSYDTLAPRRNGATLAILDASDVVIAVGAADPIGLQRLIRGLVELRDTEISAPVWVVLNRVRDAVVPGKPEVELAAALQRFAGRSPAAFLPYDRDALDAAMAHGKTLGETGGNSRLRQRMGELASALAGVPARSNVGRRRRA